MLLLTITWFNLYKLLKVTPQCVIELSFIINWICPSQLFSRHFDVSMVRATACKPSFVMHLWRIRRNYFLVRHPLTALIAEAATLIGKVLLESSWLHCPTTSLRPPGDVPFQAQRRQGRPSVRWKEKELNVTRTPYWCCYVCCHFSMVSENRRQRKYIRLKIKN